MKNTFKIDIKLLNSLNDDYAGSSHFNDWAESPEIVPTDLEHKKLLENHTISPEIYKYYNRINLFEPFTDSLFKEWKDAFKNVLHEKWLDVRATPYNLKICNAYYYRPDFLFKLGAIVYDSPVYFDGKEIKDLLDLKDYYLEYAKGFNEGYKSFMDNKIKSHYDIFADRKTYLNKVFEFITARPTHKKHYWGKLTFKSDFSKNILGAYEDGLLQGYYYQAWSIVFLESEFFSPLFRDINLQTNDQKQVEAAEVYPHPKHDPNLWSSECYNLFKYFFDNFYKGKKRQLTNIWFFLNEHDPMKYTLKATKDRYKVFILENYRIEITNFDKQHSNYTDKVYPTLNDHRQNFENSLK